MGISPRGSRWRDRGEKEGGRGDLYGWIDRWDVMLWRRSDAAVLHSDVDRGLEDAFTLSVIPLDWEG